MAQHDEVEIKIQGNVDFATAQAYVSRIRAALQNNMNQITIHLAPDTTISSAEFIGFLATTAKYMKENKRKLVMKGITGNHKELLKICRLENFIEIIS
ncbi:MAG: STAS domain-containing protein [Desulfobacterales bacterium]|nr:STAS domain-containing protein [Desulfobacterales bacterium]